MVRGSNLGRGEIFRTCPDRPLGPPSLLYNGYRFFPGAKSGRGVTLTPYPFLVPWSRKSRAILLLLLWAVRPVQSLSACTRVHCTFFLLCIPTGKLCCFTEDRGSFWDANILSHSPPFIKPEDSLCSKQPAAASCPEPDKCNLQQQVVLFKPLKTKITELQLKIQSVPRSKHIPSRLWNS